ncbi:phosphate signaling complex protein PhoU [Aestuariimicrobium ganziense]|uniref:phosphate signaling complex protein PhoU n=1 Tax=Aestuariimicrobium ganziense TaxID=2773677 RepID=UPI0019457731|nr:phosphate signaling complex protein PhoU [Aestuariimicrobium ganziense]
MRNTYREELETLTHDLVAMTRAVQTACVDATRSLVNADLAVAERVIGDDIKIDEMGVSLEQRAFTLLARQSPVAGELRQVVAVLRMTMELGRMGDLSAHVAKIARMRYPEKAVPAALESNFAEMARVADQMIGMAAQTLENADAKAALELATDDERMDELRRDQFRALLSKDWSHGVEAAVDCALLGRYYERIADHAVAIGRRTIYIVTGEAPEGEDWPTTY